METDLSYDTTSQDNAWELSLISVIVPIFNAEKYLAECVESILVQTHWNLEVILVDDGSTDGSSSIMETLKRRDSRVKTYSQANQGVSVARNTGISLAEGRYIGFVDSDDTICGTMYEKLLASIHSAGAQAATLSQYSIRTSEEAPWPPGNIVSSDSVAGREAQRLLLELRLPTSMWAYLYRRDILTGLVCDPRIHFFEDLVFNALALARVERVSLVGETLYCYRSTGDSINSQDLNAKHLSCLRIYDEVLKPLLKDDSDLLNVAQFFRAHCVVAMIARASRSASVSDATFDSIRASARALRRERYPRHVLTVAQRIVVFGASMSPRSLCLLVGAGQRCRSTATWQRHAQGIGRLVAGRDS